MSGPTQPDPQYWGEALLWLERADEDLRLAERILADIDFSASAAFHCQQAAEKMAKAVLVAFRADYPRIHDIAELGREVAVIHPDLGQQIADLSGLTDWYITSRYPGLEYSASQEDTRFAVQKLKNLRQQINSLAPKRSE